MTPPRASARAREPQTIPMAPPTGLETITRVSMVKAMFIPGEGAKTEVRSSKSIALSFHPRGLGLVIRRTMGDQQLCRVIPWANVTNYECEGLSG